MSFEFLDRPVRRHGIDWNRLNLIVLDYEHLPVVIARLGVESVVVAPIPDWWPDALGPVLMLSLGRHPFLLWMDASTGAWRTEDNSQRGSDLASLGVLMWRAKPFDAARRLAKLCGLDGVPSHDR